MSTAGDNAASLALALGFAMLALCRPRTRLLLSSAQAILVGIALLPTALPSALLIAALGGGGPLLLAAKAPEAATRPTPGWLPLASGILLATMVVLALPPEFRIRLGPGAAMTAAGLLLSATSRADGIIAGLFAAQNGLALAAGQSSMPLALQAAAAVPLLPGVIALVPLAQRRAWFRRRDLPLPYLPPAMDAAGAALSLLASGAMLASPHPAGPWFAFLSAVAAALTAWAAPSQSSWSALRRLGQLAGSMLAFLADDLILGWLGFALAALAAIPNVRRAGIPSLLVLGGVLLLCLAAPHNAPPAWSTLLANPDALDPRLIALAAIPLLIGFLLPATRAAYLDPAWSALFLLTLYRLLMAIEPTPMAAIAHHLLPPFALAGMLAFAILSWATPRSRIAAAHAVQACAAAFALGLGGDAGRAAGLLQISLLILSLAAIHTAQPGSPAARLARAGLAGIPPLGLFGGLALTGLTAASTPWMLIPFVAALALNAWVLLRGPHLPPAPRPARTGLIPIWIAPAWIAIGLALLLGLGPPGLIARVTVSP